MHETGGGHPRDGRKLDGPAMQFDLRAEVDRLRAEPSLDEFGRVSRTLAKADRLRLVLTAARAGTDVGENDLEAPLAIHVLEGRLSVRREGEELALHAGSVGWLGAGPEWTVRVDQDAVMLLTLAWPGGPEAGR